MSGAQAVAGPWPAAGGVRAGACRVLAGTTSWAERSLVRDGGFYPARSLTAAQRLAYYASRLPLAEVATTYRFPPTPEVTRRWANLTPDGFTMDVQAWSLLSGAPTWPESLWPDLQGYARPASRPGAKLYRNRLPVAVVEECWDRFRHSLAPLLSAGRLGAVVVRFPGWFRPGPEAWEELAGLPVRLEGCRVAVELANERWFQGDACEHTLAFLEHLGLGFVCRDGAGPGRPVVAATHEVGFVRFAGRRQWGEEVPGEEVWWSYRYSPAELAAWVPAVMDLASCTSEVHLVMDNCWRSDAVDNAGQLLELVAEAAARRGPA